MVAFVDRAHWSARAPRTRTADSSYRGIAVHWNGPKIGWPWAHSSCPGKVKGIQNFHMDSRGWADIAYNFLACGHGYVFEGRGWDTRSAANGDSERNSTWLAVCYLGGEGDGFPEDGRRAVRWVLNEAQHRGHGEWTTHRSIKATACPGDEIHSWVKAGAPISGSAPVHEEDDMTDEDRKKLNTIHSLITWGFVTPATDKGHPDLSKPAFGPTGELTHHLRRTAKRIERIEDTVAELKAAGATGGLSDADVQRIADSVIDSLAAQMDK